MNIALFLRNLKGRGVSKVYINLAKALKEYGYNPFIILREEIIDFDSKNLPIVVFKDNVTKNFDNFIRDKNIDFIISNNVKYTLGLKNIDSEKILYSVHMLWGDRVIKQFRIKKWFELKREYNNKNIIAVSRAVKNDLENRLKIKAKNIWVIPDIFDFDEIEKKSFEFTPKFENYIINVGALDRDKNQRLLLKNFAKLTNNYKLLIIGKGKEEENLKKLAKKLKIEDRVFFLGFIKNPYPYIKNAKLMVLTSKSEGLHGVGVESLYLQTPLVSIDSKGIRDVLKGEYSSFITKEKDLLSNIKRALKDYPYINKDKIKKRFGFSLVKEYEKIFSESVK